MEQKGFIAIYNWVNHKSIKNFINVYRDSFRFRFMWWRPLWRCWRIIKHTYIDKRYDKVVARKDYQAWFLNITTKN